MNVLNRINDKFKLALQISSLGLNSSEKFKIFCLILLFPFIKRIRPLAKKEVRFNLSLFKQNFSIFYRNLHEEVLMLKEIFYEQEYGILDLNSEPRVIFDFGSNIGFSAIFFALKYPNAKIYAFEPNPPTFLQLQKNTIAFKNITTINAAISDTNGNINFYPSALQSVGASMVKRQESENPISVNSITVGEAIKQSGVSQVDLLKFDIEGAEYSAFANPDELNNVGAIIGELHEDLATDKRVKLLDILFSKFNLQSNMLNKSYRKLVFGVKK